MHLLPEGMHCPHCGEVKLTPWTARAHIRRHKPKEYPGVRFRISTLNGVVLDVDSADLYFAARYGGQDDGCTPACVPGCEKHGWTDLIAGGPDGAMEFTRVPLKIQVRPVMLSA
jgi:hypothetical protein